MVIATKEMEAYFSSLMTDSTTALNIAKKARLQGYDAARDVEIQLARNMAERVVGIISVVAPQIIGSGIVERIIELEIKYGALDWRISLIIAHEIAEEKFCKFNNKKEAIEVGVRTGFAYSTVGVVSSPLDGLINIDIKKRLDGKGEYFCLNYAGPIRNAGGTNAAVSVLIADYVRKKSGYSTYDPDEREIKRTYTELMDYHERVTNLQYFPSEAEVEFLMKNMPIEISGDPSERFEVSNYKDLPRISTNLIRSGFCLIHSSCIPLKAKKLWKQLSSWGHEFDMEQWDFMEEFLNIQKKAASKGSIKSTSTESKITPDFTFIKDMVAGRPVLSYPLAKGGFRLRFGRSRTSGYSAQSIHPATMHVLRNYIALGTQLKVERPGKGAIMTSCDTLEGPIVKLASGEVLCLETESQAKQYKKDVVEVLFIGDVLINFGDFLNRAHSLVPPGYCEEWWILELEKATVSLFGSLDFYKLAELTQIPEHFIIKLFGDFFYTKPTATEAIILSKNLGIPLHPRYTFHWKDIEKETLLSMMNHLLHSKLVFEDNLIKKIIIKNIPDLKRNLEILGVPHIIATEYIVIQDDFAQAFNATINLDETKLRESILKFEGSDIKDSLDLINMISEVSLRDKSGVFIGARMGRPEKSKMRKLTGSPHTLFPVGEEGGKMRSFQSAFEAGFIEGDFATYYCPKCSIESIFSVCMICGEKLDIVTKCEKCGKYIAGPVCKIHEKEKTAKKKKIPIKEHFDFFMKKINMTIMPELIKGVRGTSNSNHIPENLVKGILRSKYGIFVNKDGTVRFDCTEIPCTHFMPKEIGTAVEKLVQLGYTKDISGVILTDDSQILELKPQDVILPSPPESPDEPSDKVLIRVCNFIDDLLVNFYGLEPYYNIKSRDELTGHLIIGLAPHTSAGMLGRIIGFSKMQGILAHPYYHAANRRDCDGDELGFMLLMDAFLNFSKSYLSSSRGSTMDAPLVLTSVLAPTEVDDMAFDVDIAWKYPLEFYEACLNYKKPWDIKIKTIKDVLNTELQYEGMGFTHNTANFNDGVICSAYKTLPSMEEKLSGQMLIAESLRSVNQRDVARLVIERHFIKDIKGNLRKFSMQIFRCVNCNEKFRRPPIMGKCPKCGGKIIFTISQGSIIKYLEPAIELANKYDVAPYLKQTLDLTRDRIDGVFGKEKEVQQGLSNWI